MVEIPEHLLKRSQAAKAKAEEGAEGDGEDTAAQDAAEAAEAADTAAPAAAPAAAEEAGSEAGSGIPAHLAARSAAAKAKKAGGGNGGKGGGKGKAAVKTAAPALGKQRMLAVIKSGSIQQTKAEPVDKVNVWPHLLVAEFLAMMICTLFLLVFSSLINAPLLAEANYNKTPNPSKAPWYFLGLQELLAYFDPMIAGVTIPGMGIFGLIVVPYIDRNPSTRPEDRKFAITLFTFFLMFWAVLVILGSFFRGQGYNFAWPWADGVFFDL